MTKVSVCMITYNHANYIEKAIESILSQIGNFDTFTTQKILE